MKRELHGSSEEKLRQRRRFFSFLFLSLSGFLLQVHTTKPRCSRPFLERPRVSLSEPNKVTYDEEKGGDGGKKATTGCVAGHA